jgi:hypothetical protein
MAGKLTVSEDLTLGTRGGDEQIAVGEYNAELKFKSKKKLILSFKEGEETKKYTFRIPKGTEIPTRNGSIALSASDVKQPYDLAGTVATAVTRSEQRSGNETCTYRERYTRCTVDQNGRRQCYTDYRDVRGWRFVRYHVRTDTRTLSINLTTPGQRFQSAQFAGGDVEKFRIYEYTGICR